jgi:hypothetical protein
MKLSSFVMLSSRDAKLSSWVVAELSLVVVAVELSFVVAAAELTLVVPTVELSAVVVVAKAKLSLLVVATELTVIVVAPTQVIAVVVAMTQVATVVVAALEVAAVVVMSPNWKIQSLPCQTQCPACTIGCDSQHSFQVSIHYSLQGIPGCFYGAQVLPCPQVLLHIPFVLNEN